MIWANRKDLASILTKMIELEKRIKALEESKSAEMTAPRMEVEEDPYKKFRNRKGLLDFNMVESTKPDEDGGT